MMLSDRRKVPNMTDKIHIVLASDANYRPGLEVTRASILQSCSEPERLEWHIFDEGTLKSLNGIETFESYHTSRMTYLRLWLPELLPEVDRVVYSDVDTIWTRDVCELWDSVSDRCDEVSVCWVKDFEMAAKDAQAWFEKAGASVDVSRYGCAGVCLMNLRKMRQQGLSRRALALVEKCGGCPPLADQDILNAIYNNDCLMIPSCWNVILTHEPWREPAVYHIIGIGRHFHDAKPLAYPPQYMLWDCVRRMLKVGAGRAIAPLPVRYRIMSALWWMRKLAWVLPSRFRWALVRQMFFAKVLVGQGWHAKAEKL